MADQELVAKRVPGTAALVDGFRFQSPEFPTYFLTHAHSDHTTGLTRSFSAGTIYCSRVTAELVLRDAPRVRDASRVVALDVGRRHEVADPRCGSFDVTLVDANHCPGACILVFDVPCEGGGQKGKKEKKKRIVHTGDFRFHPLSHGSHPLLGCRPLSPPSGLPVDVLLLDTTYAHPRHDHPPQERCVRACAEFIRRETLRSLPAAAGACSSSASAPPASASASASLPLVPLPPPLFVFGSYRIGKERLYLGVAQELNERIWVPPQKRRLLELMGLLCDGDDDNVKSDDDGHHHHHHHHRRYPRSLLAEHPSQARLHVAPMGQSLAPPALLSRIQNWGSGNGNGGGNGSGGNGNSVVVGHARNGGNGGAAPSSSSCNSFSAAPSCPWGRVVGIRPTGWTWRRPKKQKKPQQSKGGSGNSGKGNGKDADADVEDDGDLLSLVSCYSPIPNVVTIAGVPYSEHSSFPELRAAVAAMKPAKLIPTVTGGTAGDRTAIARRFEDLLDRSRDRSRLDYFFFPSSSSSSSFSFSSSAAAAAAAAASASSCRLARKGAKKEEEKEEEAAAAVAAAAAAAAATAAASDVIRIKEEKGSDDDDADDEGDAEGVDEGDIDGDDGGDDDDPLSWGPEVGGDDWTIEEEEEEEACDGDGDDDGGGKEREQRKAATAAAATTATAAAPPSLPPPPLPSSVPFDLSSVDEDEQRRILAEIQAVSERDRLLRDGKDGKRKRRQPTLREALFGGGASSKKNK